MDESLSLLIDKYTGAGKSDFFVLLLLQAKEAESDHCGTTLLEKMLPRQLRRSQKISKINGFNFYQFSPLLHFILSSPRDII